MHAAEESLPKWPIVAMDRIGKAGSSSIGHQRLPLRTAVDAARVFSRQVSNHAESAIDVEGDFSAVVVHRKAAALAGTLIGEQMVVID